MSETEEFWSGNFGDEYSKRNVDLVENNRAFFHRIFSRSNVCSVIESVAEIGAGTGQNISALRKLLGDNVMLTAVEINTSAAAQMAEDDDADIIINKSIFNTPRKGFISADLVITKGFLIHVHPDQIHDMYERLYHASTQFILICEYYNPYPVKVEYRGHDGKMWKRDFCGEIMDMFPDLKLLHYGFTYHKDKNPQDDLTWFLLEKP